MFIHTHTHTHIYIVCVRVCICVGISGHVWKLRRITCSEAFIFASEHNTPQDKNDTAAQTKPPFPE